MSVNKFWKCVALHGWEVRNGKKHIRLYHADGRSMTSSFKVGKIGKSDMKMVLRSLGLRLEDIK